MDSAPGELRPVEQAAEVSAQHARPAGKLGGGADLALDLVLEDQHGVQARRDPEQVPSGLGANAQRHPGAQLVGR